MKCFKSSLVALVLSCAIYPAHAECNRPEYKGIDSWVTPCNALGVAVDPGRMSCPDDKFATAKAELDWVLFEDAVALDSYRASVKEQLDCGYPQMQPTYVRAVTVAVKAHNPQAQCAILLCIQKINRYMQDLEDQGKIPGD
jgi:hypothetical protein